MPIVPWRRHEANCDFRSKYGSFVFLCYRLTLPLDLLKPCFIDSGPLEREGRFWALRVAKSDSRTVEKVGVPTR